MTKGGGWYARSVEEVSELLQVRPATGLLQAEAERRLERYGRNAIAEARRRTPVLMLLRQFTDFMVFVLLAAAVLAGVLGEPQDIVAIVVIVVLNATLGFVQEYRAERAMTAFRSMAALEAQVRRAGETRSVPAAEVVPGDVVLIETGNVIPADLRVAEVAKRRRMLARVLSGSTAHDLARTVDVPILVTVGKSARIARVLVAVDLSPAARPTLTAAAALARQLGAGLRVMHVVEPIRYTRVAPRTLDRGIFFRQSVEMFKRLASSFSGGTPSDIVVRQGSAASTIAAEAMRWKADVVVVGSQGKGFVDRLLIGSTTEWLLNLLPTSLLVVPATRVVRAAQSRRARLARTRRPVGSAV